MISSNLASEYRKACADLIHRALPRPHMYFGALKEMEAIMRGHAMAFRSMEMLKNEKFHSDFGRWLEINTGEYPSAGWAYSIEALASAEGIVPVEMFAKLVRRFLAEWLADCPTLAIQGTDTIS